MFVMPFLGNMFLGSGGGWNMYVLGERRQLHCLPALKPKAPGMKLLPGILSVVPSPLRVRMRGGVREVRGER